MEDECDMSGGGLSLESQEGACKDELVRILGWNEYIYFLSLVVFESGERTEHQKVNRVDDLQNSQAIAT